MDDCCATDLEAGFDEGIAAGDLRAYRRDGLPGDQRRLLAALLAEGMEDRTILDIGGGVGAIHHDLLRAGARSVTDVDGSTAYLQTAEREARRQGDIDRVRYEHGDFVQLADRIEPADAVLLLRVLCCYPDMPTLVGASTAKARRWYALIYPRSTWWLRGAAKVYDLLRPVIGPGSGPGYVHDERDVDAAVRAAGFSPMVEDATRLWRIALYRRTGSPAA